jgi:L-aminopeptidase/D-esterase-like protein
VEEGNVGAGTGCTVAKRLGPQAEWKGGLGSLAGEVRGYHVGALVAVNAVGDVYDPDDRSPVALARGGPGWVDPVAGGPAAGENTTLAVVCTDAPFDRNQLCFLARMAMNGMARSLAPPLTPFDGDLVFTATTAERGLAPADDRLLAEVGEVAMELVARAIVRGVRAATSLHGIPGVGGP